MSLSTVYYSKRTPIELYCFERMEPSRRKEAKDPTTEELRTRETTDPSDGSTVGTSEDGCDDRRINAAREYFRYVNTDPDGLRKICHPLYTSVFKTIQGAKVTLEDIIYEVKSIRRSFPDYRFKDDQSEYIMLPDGRVKVTVVVEGTHTGAPYGFGPFTPIPPTGIKVQNDPETVTFRFDKNDCIIRETCIICAPGAHSGPQGLYLQIGGKVDF